MTWAYGIVAHDGKLIISEIYFDKKNQPYGWVPVTLKETKAKRTRKMISEDISSQIANSKIFAKNDFKNGTNDLKEKLKKDKWVEV